MKKLVLATVVMASVAAAATTAYAAGESYYLFKDTVGNCAAMIGTGVNLPGQTVMSKTAYSSLAAANKALPDLKGCKGLVK